MIVKMKKKKNQELDIKRVQELLKMKEKLLRMKKNKNKNLKKSLSIKRMISLIL
jgi:cystathionine beta-lyase family protein involved in aluminum resistance